MLQSRRVDVEKCAIASDRFPFFAVQQLLQLVDLMRKDATPLEVPVLLKWLRYSGVQTPKDPLVPQNSGTFFRVEFGIHSVSPFSTVLKPR